MSVGGPPDRLNQRHMLMAYMEVMGLTPAELAESLRYHRNRVYHIRRAQCYREKVAEIREKLEEYLIRRTIDIHSRLDVEAHAALDTLRSILTDPTVPASARLRAAVEVLDRAPNAPKKAKGPRKQPERGDTTLRIPMIRRFEWDGEGGGNAA